MRDRFFDNRLGLRCGFCCRGLGRRGGVRRLAAVSNRDETLADANLVAGLHMHLGDHAGSRGRNRGHGLFIFQFEHVLILRDLVAFLYEDIDHHAGIRPLAKLGKFYIHKLNQANSVEKDTFVFQK